MKIHIMTDLEGIAGVVNSEDYCGPTGRHYELACELGTLEASAAAEGAFEAGATEVLVADGHGGGSMRRHLLHPRALLLTGNPSFPFGYDSSFAGAMIIGQHAKANTDGGHLCHTGNFLTENLVINDVSLGETGTEALAAGYFGVPVLMLSGDQAACDEARALLPNIETAAVKRGICKGSVTGMTPTEARAFNTAAVHLHPDVARARIREAAYRAVKRVKEFAPLRFEPPYRMVLTRRPLEGEPTRKGKVFTVESNDMLDILMGRVKIVRSPEWFTPAPAKASKAKGASNAVGGKKSPKGKASTAAKRRR